MTTYVISSVLWALAGLVCGYLVGRAATLAQFNVSEEEAPPVITRRSFRAENLVGILVVALSVISVVTTAVNVGRQEAAVKCQTQFNRAFTAALRERTEAAQAEREAQRSYLTYLLQPDITVEQRRAATVGYRDSLTAAEELRDANPLPEDPGC